MGCVRRLCADTHAISASTDKLRGATRNHGRNMHQRLEIFLHRLLLLLFPLRPSLRSSPPATCAAYLQVSAGVAGRFPPRHFTADLHPRTARSFAGFAQTAAALLPLFLLPPSSFCSSLLSIYSCVRGGGWRGMGGEGGLTLLDSTSLSLSLSVSLIRVGERGDGEAACARS